MDVFKNIVCVLSITLSLLIILALTECRPVGEQKAKAVTNGNESSLEDSLAMLNVLVEKHPQNAAYYFQRGLIYFRKGNATFALADFDSSIRREPNNAQFYHTRGFVRYSEEDFKAALRDYEQAAALGAKDPETFQQCGNVLVAMGDYAASLKWYDKAILLSPQEPHYYFAKAFALRRLNRTDEAISSAQKALGVDSTYTSALNLLFEIYLDDKPDYVKAERYAQKMLLVDSLHPLGQFDLGIYFYRRYATERNSETARKYLIKSINAYTQALKRQPNYVQALYQRGFDYLELKDNERALADFEKVLLFNPTHHQALFMMGAVYEAYNEPKRALDYYERALTAKPGFKEAEQAIAELKRKG